MDNSLITIKNVRGYIGENGKAFLNLEDVARGLGFTRIANSGNEVVMWSRVEKYMKDLACTLVCTERKEEFIPENIFYKLCMKANNEVARKFQDLVCDEILPSIRQNGGYIVSSENDSDEEILARALIVAQKTIDKKNERIRSLEVDNKIQAQQLAELKPIKDYVDTILSSEDTLTISQIAADYGKSGKKLNKILHEQRVIRKVGGQWILYKEHMNKGYTKSETTEIPLKNGDKKLIINTKWTQKGRLKIHEIMTELGVVAICDKK